MKLLTVFFVFLVGLSFVQPGDSCGGLRPLHFRERLHVSPIRNATKTSNNNSADLDIILPRQGDASLLSVVEDGARRGLKECQRLFQSKMTWNCPVEMYKKLPLFDNKTLPSTTREMAFIQAVSAAAITYEITHQCTQNKIPGCGCPSWRTEGSLFQWSGECGDHILFGERKSRPFTDRLNKQQDPQTVVHLHNNEVGREIVRTSAVVSCKCFGVNTACGAKSCWKKLAPFEVVASKLKEKYDVAMRVRLVHKKLWDEIDREVSLSGQKLVYLDDTPSPCEQNDTLGYHGMLGRSCRSDVAKDKCECFIGLCNGCNLRVQKVERYKRFKCNCKFIYCCKVECEECTETYSEITCNALKPEETDIVGRSHP